MSYKRLFKASLNSFGYLIADIIKYANAIT